MCEVVRCLRCNRVLTAKESIERGYGLKCYRIVQLNAQRTNNDTDIQFLKCEINMLKRQYKELKAKGFIAGIEPIERIGEDQHRPERDPFKIEFNIVVKELKIVLQGDNFDYHKILKPIDVREEPEKPPVIESLELITN